MAMREMGASSTVLLKSVANTPPARFHNLLALVVPATKCNAGRRDARGRLGLRLGEFSLSHHPIDAIQARTAPRVSIRTGGGQWPLRADVYAAVFHVRLYSSHCCQRDSFCPTCNRRAVDQELERCPLGRASLVGERQLSMLMGCEPDGSAAICRTMLRRTEDDESMEGLNVDGHDGLRPPPAFDTL